MKKSALSITLELKASRFHRSLLAIIGLLVAFSITYSALPAWTKFLCALAALVALVSAWARAERMQACRLFLSADDRCVCVMAAQAHAWPRSMAWLASPLGGQESAEGEWHGRVAGFVKLGPLIALDLVSARSGRKMRLAIWADMLEADAWRKLVVRFLHSGSSFSGLA